MTQVTADFELGTNGNSISTGDPGSATAWDLVQRSGSVTSTYSNAHAAHGTLSAQMNEVTGSANWLEWSTSMGSTVDNYGRVYMWINALDVGVTQVWCHALDNTDAQIVQFLINGSGVLRMINSAAAFAGPAGTVTAATGQWIRLEYKIVNHATNGILECKLFNNASSAVADDTITATSQNTLANTSKVRFGTITGNNAGYIFFMDDIVAGATSYPGPVVEPSTAPQVMIPRHAVGGGRW